jgi:hypothetical protein
MARTNRFPVSHRGCNADIAFDLDWTTDVRINHLAHNQPYGVTVSGTHIPAA